MTLPEEGDVAIISSRPDFSILCYPVITLGEFTHPTSKRNLLGENYDPADAEKLSLEKSVNANSPPAFLYHRLGDTYVPCENSILYAEALRKCGVPFELHIYEKGNHGGARWRKNSTAVSIRWAVFPCKRVFPVKNHDRRGPMKKNHCHEKHQCHPAFPACIRPKSMADRAADPPQSEDRTRTDPDGGPSAG